MTHYKIGQQVTAVDDEEPCLCIVIADTEEGVRVLPVSLLTDGEILHMSTLYTPDEAIESIQALPSVVYLLTIGQISDMSIRNYGIYASQELAQEEIDRNLKQQQWGTRGYSVWENADINPFPILETLP